MNKQIIFKYDVSPKFDLELPVDARILTVQMQRDSAQLWVQLDPTAPKITRSFTYYETGHPFDPTGHQYIGTFQIDWIVMHLFEIIGEASERNTMNCQEMHPQMHSQEKQIILAIRIANMMEAAAYLGYSTKTAGVAIAAYEIEVGHEVRIKNGPSRYISEKDLEKILIARKPFEARRRGLIKD